MDQIPFSKEKTILHIRQNLRHLFHIRAIRLKLDRSEKDLPCRKLQHEEHRTADQFSAHKKLNGKEVTGGQDIPMALDKLMPGGSDG
jgi:hypothetical protein